MRILDELISSSLNDDIIESFNTDFKMLNLNLESLLLLTFSGILFHLKIIPFFYFF